MDAQQACERFPVPGTIDYTTIEQANDTRAGWAAEAMRVYTARTGVTGEEVDTAVTDLIGDLLHLLALTSDSGTAAVEPVLDRARACFHEELVEF